MDIRYGFSRLLVRGSSLKERCGSCATAQRAADPRSRRPTEHLDEDDFVISGDEVDGLVVVPRPHVSGLEELTITHRAGVLAALRRATRSVGKQNLWSAPTIVVRTDLPGSEGHVSFQVLPWAGNTEGKPARDLDARGSAQHPYRMVLAASGSRRSSPGGSANNK